jgi:serine/threonine protein kinase
MWEIRIWSVWACQYGSDMIGWSMSWNGSEMRWIQGKSGIVGERGETDCEYIDVIDHPCLAKVLYYQAPMLDVGPIIATDDFRNASLYSLLQDVRSEKPIAFWTVTNRAVVIRGIVCRLKSLHSRHLFHGGLKPSDIPFDSKYIVCPTSNWLSHRRWMLQSIFAVTNRGYHDFLWQSRLACVTWLTEQFQWGNIVFDVQPCQFQWIASSLSSLPISIPIHIVWSVISPASRRCSGIKLSSFPDAGKSVVALVF